MRAGAAPSPALAAGVVQALMRRLLVNRLTECCWNSALATWEVGKGLLK